MVGSNGTMIAIRLVRSKLRKREEHSNSVHPTDVVLHQTATPPPSPHAPPQATQQTTVQSAPLTVVGNGQQQRAEQTPATNTNGESVTIRTPYALWQYPPQPQPLYTNTQEVNVQNLSTERPGFVRGFRKNLGGRWRRLVKKKPETEAYTIPAELRPQLKQIYVY